MARPRTRMTEPDHSPPRAFSTDANLTRRDSSNQLQNPAVRRGRRQEVTATLDYEHESQIESADTGTKRTPDDVNGAPITKRTGAEPRVSGQRNQPPLRLEARLHISLGGAQISMSRDALHVPQARTRLGTAAAAPSPTRLVNPGSRASDTLRHG